MGIDDNYIKEPICVDIRGREPQVLSPVRTEYGKQIRKEYEKGKIKTERKNIQQLEPRNDGITNTITSVQKDNLIMKYKGVAVHPFSKKLEFNGFKDGNSPALLATDYKAPKCVQFGHRIRRLTPLECFRLQGFPDSFIKPCSDSQTYKQAGNSITVNVMQAILKNLLLC